MIFKTYDTEYRKNLDSLCAMSGFKNVVLFDYVKDFIPRSLKIVGSPDSSVKQINCHGYTFKKDCWYAVKNVHDAITSGILIEVEEPDEGDIIIYYLDESADRQIIKHTGIYLGEDKVRSKWANGPVFIHNVFNVPHSYGKIVKFFKETQAL